MSSVLERKPAKAKRCKACREQFTPARPLQHVCSPGCAAAMVSARRLKEAAKREQEERKAIRAKLMDLKPLSYWRDRAQRAFNAWVRARDAGLPCVSCGRHHAGKVNAGHYLSRGARPELAFEPMNVHLQCEPCNTSLSGNVVLFRAELVRRIGVEKVEWLEGLHEPTRYRAEDYRRIEAEYRAKAKALERDRSWPALF